jgi:hypothetical protein
MARRIDRPAALRVAAMALLAACGGCKQRPRPPTADPQAAVRLPVAGHLLPDEIHPLQSSRSRS